MPAGQNTDAFTKLLRRRADNLYLSNPVPGEPWTGELLREAAHRLELIERVLRAELPVVEDGLYAPDEDPVSVGAAFDALARILAAGCGGPPVDQLTITAGQVPQPGPAAAPPLP